MNYSPRNMRDMLFIIGIIAAITACSHSDSNHNKHIQQSGRHILVDLGATNFPEKPTAEVLLSYLDNPTDGMTNPTLSSICEALFELADDPSLIQGLNDASLATDPYVKTNACFSLYLLGLERVDRLGDIISVLQECDDDNIAFSIGKFMYNCLNEEHDSDCLELFLRYADSGDEEVDLTAVFIFGCFPHNHTAFIKITDLADSLNPEVRRQVAISSAQMINENPSIAEDPLITTVIDELLSDESYMVRFALLSVLDALPSSQEIIDILGGMALHDEEGAIREQVIDIFRRKEPVEEILPYIWELADDESTGVRLAAYRYLGDYLSHEDFIALLQEISNDDNERIKEFAESYLIQLNLEDSK